MQGSKLRKEKTDECVPNGRDIAIGTIFEPVIKDCSHVAVVKTE